ncbi:hypothetical protein BST94_10055 [Nonlabens xylanidelens]|nr:hypothetical protein BST94_10055 [Nonlabens xylanidelens]
MENSFKSRIKWWESKRWIYNLIILIASFISIYEIITYYHYSIKISDLLIVVVWLIGANIFYSLGILTELIDWYYFNNKIKFYRYRWLFFVSGIVFSFLWTVLNISNHIYPYPIII